MMRLVEWLAGMLAPAEREAVLGDIVESGVTGLNAVRDAASVVIRRPLAWVQLIAGCVAGAVMGELCRWKSYDAAIDSWLYCNNFSWAFLRDPAFRQNVSIDVPPFVLSLLALALWSWITGFLLVSVSGRRTLAFFVVLFAFEFSPVSVLPSHAAVFANSFYRLLFPLLVKILFVIIPAVVGMRTREGVKA
jgi:hypothetical protein